MEEIVYFEFNNWDSSSDYMRAEPYRTWFETDFNIPFNNLKWVKDNKLCVVRECIDMSMNFCVTATKEWVKETCPSMLTMYKEVLREDGIGRWGTNFLPYLEENIGIFDMDEDENLYKYEDIKNERR